MLILDHEQYDMVYEGNFEGHFAVKINRMYISHIIYVLSCIIIVLLYYYVREIYIKHLIKLEFCLTCLMVVIRIY